MIVWVLYDISNDKARTRAAKCCKQAGLYRVQLSVFLGSLDANAQDELALQLLELIDEAQDKVYIFPMSQAELKQTKLLGQAFDKKLVSDKVKLLLL